MRVRYFAGLVLVAAAAFTTALLVPASARTRERLGDDCVRASHRESCDELGDRLDRGDLASRFPEEPGLYLALACEQGSSRSCDRAQGWARSYPDYETFEVDVGCMLRQSAFACEELATTLRDGDDDGPSAARSLPLARSRMRRALDLYLDACAHDDAASCLGASRVYARGFGVPWSPREARSFEAKACALGLAEACESEGDDRVGADTAGAAAVYRKACERVSGSPHACLKMARAYDAAGAPAATVANAYRTACEKLSFDGCSWIAGRVDGLEGESTAVIRAFRRWCDAGSSRACELVNRLPARAHL